MTSFPCDFRLPRSFYGIWTSFFIAKIVAAFFLPPVDDEAYYWVWGRNAALGYFDHPGMVGWMNLLGLAPGFFRIPFIVANQLSVLILAGAGREHFGFNERKLLLVLLLFDLIPVTGVGTWPGLILAGVAFSESLARYAIGYFSAIYAVGAVVLLCLPSLLPNKAKEPFAMQTLVRETSSLPVLYGATYQIASQLGMQQGRPVFKPKGLARFDMYDIWKQPSLPARFHLAYKTSSGPPRLMTHLPNEDSNRKYGIYSVVDMVDQL